MSCELQLREVLESDYSVLFAHQRDPVAAWMAGFGTKDSDAGQLAARWERSLADGSTTARTIVENGCVVGFVATFSRDEKPQVTYWIARSHWGRGIATAALLRFLQWVTVRPLYASTAKDNVASLRVLEKCGFTVRGSAKAFAEARNEEIDEIFLELG